MAELWESIWLARPEWLAAWVLVPLLAVMVRGSLVRESTSKRIATLLLRSLALTLLILALCEPVVEHPGKAPWTALLVDRSASIDAAGEAAAKALVADMVARSTADRAVVIPFAATAGRPCEGKWPEAAGLDPTGTDLATALADVSSIDRPGGPARVVVLSDGNATVPGDAVSWAASLQVPVDTTALAARRGDDAWIESVTIASEVRAGDPAGMEVVAASNRAGKAVVRVLAGNEEVGRKEVDLPAGRVTVPFELESGDGPGRTYRVELEAASDGQKANNWTEVAVWPGGRGRALLAGRETDRLAPLAAVFDQNGLEVETTLVERFPQDLEGLSRFDLVVLADVPADAFAVGPLEAIESYVRQRAGGLVVFGGQDSLTAGGYRRTALERVLPVTCEFDSQAKRPSLALVLAIDQSGSMEEGNAIGLAKTALRQTVQMLDAQDQLGVIAFQDTTQWIVPLQPCGNPEKVLDEIESLTAGGGTNMHPAIVKAHLALHEAYADLKHIIVLTDGISYPGDFDNLAREIMASGITISTVAVGAEAAEPLLQSIAELGGGDYHHCTSAAEVPEIFVRETAKAARMGIREEPVMIDVSPAFAARASLSGEKPPALLGYVQTKARTGAQVEMKLETGDPLVAWWQAGRGRAAVFTSDLRGEWTRPWQSWPGQEAVWGALARLVVRPAGSDGYRLVCKRTDRTTLVTLDAVPHLGRFENDGEVAVEVTGPDRVKESVPMPRVAPGQYSVEVATPDAGVYVFRATCRVGETAVFSGRCSACPVYASEWVPRETNETLLRKMAAVTGGKFHPRAAEVVAGEGAASTRRSRVWMYLVLAAAVVMVGELALRRLCQPGSPEPRLVKE